MQGLSDDQARKADAKQLAVFAAAQNFEREQDIFQNSNNIRLDCVDGVNDHNKYIIDFSQIFEFLRAQGYTEFADALQADFDSRNPQQSVEVECAPFPPPTPPTVPQILLDEGIVVPTTDK